jgi:hypothetical protein
VCTEDPALDKGRRLRAKTLRERRTTPLGPRLPFRGMHVGGVRPQVGTKPQGVALTTSRTSLPLVECEPASAFTWPAWPGSTSPWPFRISWSQPGRHRGCPGPGARTGPGVLRNAAGWREKKLKGSRARTSERKKMRSGWGERRRCRVIAVLARRVDCAISRNVHLTGGYWRTQPGPSVDSVGSLGYPLRRCARRFQPRRDGRRRGHVR